MSLSRVFLGGISYFLDVLDIITAKNGVVKEFSLTLATQQDLINASADVSADASVLTQTPLIK